MYVLRIPRFHGGRVLSAEIARDFRKQPGVKTAATHPHTIIIEVTAWEHFFPIVATLVSFFDREGLDPKLLTWTLPSD